MDTVSPTGEARRQLLVDYCTFSNVGHIIEGLQIAGAFAFASPDWDVSILLNSRTPVELAEVCCPWLSRTFAVDFDTAGASVRNDLFAEIPREWDWIYEDWHRHEPSQFEPYPQLRRLAMLADEHFRSRDVEIPEHIREHPLRLELPAGAMSEARRIIGSSPIVLTVMTSGSAAPSQYPSADSWRLILTELRRSWPDAAIVVLGKTSKADLRRTSAMSHDDGLGLIGAIGAINGYDLPITVQLALVACSNLFVAPHTGFGFAALAVNTPWLALSGGPWYEYFHNQVPFWSVLPDTTRYPAFLGMKGSFLVDDQDGSGPRDASMSRARIVEDLPELLRAAAMLIERQCSYEESLTEYFPRLLKALGGDRTLLTSWGQVHRRYI
jgi:hypothetical protein